MLVMIVVNVMITERLVMTSSMRTRFCSLLFVLFCFTFSFLAVIPTNKKRLFSLLYGILESIILILFIRKGIIVNPYDLLNI